MAEQASRGLGYGQVGQYLYDAAEKMWIARRTFGSPYALTPLAPSQWAIKPLDCCDAGHADAPSSQDKAKHSDVPSSTDKASTPRPSRVVAAKASDLARHLPSIAPIKATVADLAHLSHDVTAVIARHDATLGNLLAFGRVTDHRTRRTLAVAAFPATTSPNRLCLMQVQPQKQGWEHNKGVWIDVSRLSGESIIWDAGQPICQLAFCAPRSDEAHAATRYLAVRTTLAVHVLRIWLSKDTDSTQPSSTRFRITPTHILDLDVLGGVPPADFVFNPFYDRQLATIDQNGTWRIWNLTHQPVGHKGKPLQIAYGATADQSVANAMARARLLDDAWGRIAWVLDTATIIVASRRAIAIYDMTDKPLRLLSPDLGISDSPHWILDVQAHPKAYPFVFVLTSVQLICLHINPLSNFDPSDYELAGAQVLFKTAHFRDPEDISLRLYTFMDGNDIVVLVKSSLSLIATSYRCTFHETSASPFLSVSEPTIVPLPEHPVNDQGVSPYSGLHIQSAAYGEGYGGPAGPGETYRNQSVRFYMMTSVNADRSIVEKLYYALAEDKSVADSSLEVVPPTWHGRLTHGVSRVQRRRFVVEDHDLGEELDTDGLRLDQQSFRPLSTKRSRSGNRRRDWTVTYERSYTRINKQSPDHMQEFADVLDFVKNNSDIQDPQNRGIDTLFDLSQAEVLVGDLDDASMQFQRLLLQKAEDAMSRDDHLPDHSSRHKPATLASATLLGLPVSADLQPGPIAIYDSIVSHWLTPISERAPGRVRLAKEQLARRVAAEVCLASYGMKTPALDQTQEESQDFTVLAPASHMMSSSHPQSSFPTPSPTATPSLTTATSLSSHPSTMAAPEYLRLQRYTTFSDEKTTPAPLPRALARKLAHWTIGGDPDEYDWLNTQRQQDKEAEEEYDDLTPKERARLKRRAEKHLRKQRRETSKATNMVMASSQAPEILSASQPAAVLQRRALPSTAKAGPVSQVIMSSPQPSQSQSQRFPTSQVEPGRFGGRPAAKKKKRNIGF